MNWLKEVPFEKNTKFYLKPGERNVDKLKKSLTDNLWRDGLRPEVGTEVVIDAVTNEVIEAITFKVGNSKQEVKDKIRDFLKKHADTYELKGSEQEKVLEDKKLEEVFQEIDEDNPSDRSFEIIFYNQTDEAVDEFFEKLKELEEPIDPDTNQGGGKLFEYRSLNVRHDSGALDPTHRVDVIFPTTKEKNIAHNKFGFSPIADIYQEYVNPLGEHVEDTDTLPQVSIWG